MPQRRVRKTAYPITPCIAARRRAIPRSLLVKPKLALLLLAKPKRDDSVRLFEMHLVERERQWRFQSR